MFSQTYFTRKALLFYVSFGEGIDFMNEIFPTLQDSKQVVGADGEFWSPRKVLRRTLWHERDHTEHLRKLL
jgi:hypothetical protein